MNKKTTVAEFKRRMTPGTQWEFTAWWCPNPVIRTCTVSRSNSAALTGVKDPTQDSWIDWPKKNETTITIDENDKMTVKIECMPSRFLEYKQL